jgi:hypothetical protein
MDIDADLAGMVELHLGARVSHVAVGHLQPDSSNVNNSMERLPLAWQSWTLRTRVAPVSGSPEERVRELCGPALIAERIA